jgi:ATP-binding cassette subfamily F protein 3
MPLTFKPETLAALEAQYGDIHEKLDDEVLAYICAAIDDEHLPMHDVNEIVAPHLIDAALVPDERAAEAALQLVAPHKCAQWLGGANAQAEQLAAPVDLLEQDGDGTNASELSLFVDGDKRASAVDQEKLAEAQERYSKRKQVRNERKERVEAKKKEASLNALRFIHEEQARSGSQFMRSKVSGGARDVHIENFSLHAGKSTLVANASIMFAYGRRYGLIGHNGVGKTTLLRAMSGRELPLPNNMSILHVHQEAEGSRTQTALACVLECDQERQALLDELEVLNSEDSSVHVDPATHARRLVAINARLDEIDAHTAEARAAAILSGLGFDDAAQQRVTASFSGGWRMRLALARALFAQPDILLLDEPTNHLDLYAVLWLEQYLLTWPKTLVIVSHSREFLNAVATDIIHIHQHAIAQYKGTYDDFERQRAERHRMSERANEAATKQRQHIQRFIDRFRFNAKRASMVQSRIKTLSKMTMLPEVHDDPAIQFGFGDPVHLPPPLLQFDDVSFQYPSAADKILRNLNLNIDMDSRVALVGPNGAGKSTLLKLLCGDLDATTGYVHRNQKLRFAVFQQHFVDQLDLDASAVEHMCRTYEAQRLQPNEARGHLGRFGVIGDLAIRAMRTLSGGQKSRVVLATIAFSQPSMLLLDEPSNHLDLDSVEALSLALTQFSGGVLLVSHDEHLISLVCDEIWVLGDAQVKRFDGTFSNYKRQLLKEVGFSSN